MHKRGKKKRVKKIIERFATFMVTVLFFYTVKILPSVIYPLLSKITGLLAFYTMSDSRKLILKNMEIVYENRLSRMEKNRICKEVFISLVHDFCETVQISKVTDRHLIEMSVIEGEENLKTALGMNRGVISIAPHMGNFPRLQTILAKKGFPINVFIRPPSGEHLARFFKKIICSANVPFIYIMDMQDAIKESIRWLNRKGILSFYVDQHFGNGVEVEFFNKKVLSPVGAATLARKYRCPVVGLFTYRMPDGKQKIIIEGPYLMQRTDNFTEDIKANTSFFMARVEHYVREHPEQWFTWLHRRFR